MTKETLLAIIDKHNASVDFIGSLDDVKIPVDSLMRLMQIACHHARLGLALTQEARAMGIDAKCCMQSGKITVYGLDIGAIHDGYSLDVDQHHPGQYADPNKPATEEMLRIAKLWMGE